MIATYSPEAHAAMYVYVCVCVSGRNLLKFNGQFKPGIVNSIEAHVHVCVQPSIQGYRQL